MPCGPENCPPLYGPALKPAPLPPSLQGMVAALRQDLKGSGVKAATVCPAGIDR